MPSITSLQTSGDKHLEPVPIESRSASRASSRRADCGGHSTRPRSAASRPESAMSSAPYVNPMVNKSVEDARSSRSRTPRTSTPMMMPRETQSSPRPKSAQSSASKNQLSVLNLNTSQADIVGGQQQTPQPSSSVLNLVPPVRHSTSRVSLREAGSFSNGFDDGTYLDPAFFPADRPADGNGHHRTPAGLRQKPAQASSSALNLASPVRHSTSRVSLREAGSFANGFDDGAYLDPAFYPSDTPVVGSHLQVPTTRPVSRGSSVLSYASN
jgi:hypothetical protein